MRWLVLMTLVMTIIVLTLILFGPLGGANRASIYPLPSRDIVLRYTVAFKNNSNQAIKNATMSIFKPLDLARQTLTAFDSSQSLYLRPIKDEGVNEYEFTSYEYGLIPPFGKTSITLTAQLSVLSEPYPEDDIDLSLYLMDGHYLKLGNPELKRLLERFKAFSQQDKPREIYQWVLESIRYAGYIQEDRGAQYALQKKSGDCTEFMYLLMAMLRASDIPARGLAGFYLQNNQQIVNASDYHNWVEYHDGKVWRILDPLNNNFSKNHGEYIVFRNIVVSAMNHGMSSQRFISHDARLESSMR